MNKPIGGMGRYLAFIDKNRDLFLTQTQSGQLHKIGTMVEAFAWNDENECLIAIMDGKLVEYHYPATTFLDEDISLLARTERDAR